MSDTGPDQQERPAGSGDPQAVSEPLEGGDAHRGQERRAGSERRMSSEPVSPDRRTGSERRVSTVDFSQPTKFAAEMRRRIVHALEPFCNAFAIRLATELRTSAELAITDSEQLTWSAAKAQLPVDAIAVALLLEPTEQRILLNLDPAIILRSLECLLGGAASQAPAERRLTEVDWALARPLLEAMTAQLSSSLRDLGGIQLALGEIDVEGDAGVVAPLGEPTFAVTIEVRIDDLPATLSLLIPWPAIAPVAEDILGDGSRHTDTDPHDGVAVQRGLAGANVLLRAEVGSTRMPVEQMLALAPGSVLELEDAAEDGVQVFAERIPLARAHPGLRGTRRAIKLITPVEPGRAQAMPAPAAPQAARSVLISGSELQDSSQQPAADGVAGAPRAGTGRLMGVPVRVWAELGRTRLPLGSALELPLGTVLELDQGAESPIELFANGKSFAQGALQVSGEGKWAVQIEALE